MVGISEVLQTISAMVIFSIILLSANRMIHRNTFIQVEGDLERQVIVLAQDVIDEARTKAFDENSTGSVPPTAIPADFTDPAALGPESGEGNRAKYNDFDDFNGWTGQVETRHGQSDLSFDLSAEVFYVEYNSTTEEFDSVGTRSTYKKLRVFVESPFLTQGGMAGSDEPKTYTFEAVRNYHAD